MVIMNGWFLFVFVLLIIDWLLIKRIEKLEDYTKERACKKILKKALKEAKKNASKYESNVDRY